MQLESEVVSLPTKVAKLEYTDDRMEQYSRRNSILIYDLPEEKGEDIDSVFIETVTEKIDLDIFSADIDRTHQIEIPPKKPGKVRPDFENCITVHNYS